jgi:hypothetical protein
LIVDGCSAQSEALNAVTALTTPADFPVYVIYFQKEFISRKQGQG